MLRHDDLRPSLRSRGFTVTSRARGVYIMRILIYPPAGRRAWIYQTVPMMDIPACPAPPNDFCAPAAAVLLFDLIYYLVRVKIIACSQ